MKKKTLIICVVITVIIIILVVGIGGYTLVKVLKEKNDSRAPEVKADLQTMLTAIDEQNQEDFESVFLDTVKSQVDVLSEFSTLKEYLGTDMQIEKGRVTQSSFKTNSGYYNDEIRMEWTIITSNGEFSIRTQSVFNSDPNYSGIVFIELIVEDGDNVFIGKGYEY